MPKISDERRAERRAAILDAARACFERDGLHATTMNDIIRRSGLSAGAVYGYFASKEELIHAALTTSMASLGATLAPILGRVPPLPPAEFIRELAGAIQRFARRDDIDLTRLAMHGWSEVQRDDALRATMQAIYAGLREQLAGVAEQWRTRGMIGADADPDEVASMLFSLVLGFVAQSAILGDADPDQHARGLAAITRPPVVAKGGRSAQPGTPKR